MSSWWQNRVERARASLTSIGCDANVGKVYKDARLPFFSFVKRNVHVYCPCNCSSTARGNLSGIKFKGLKKAIVTSMSIWQPLLIGSSLLVGHLAGSCHTVARAAQNLRWVSLAHRELFRVPLWSASVTVITFPASHRTKTKGLLRQAFAQSLTFPLERERILLYFNETTKGEFKTKVLELWAGWCRKSLETEKLPDTSTYNRYHLLCTRHFTKLLYLH